jgi:hypothetical protein
MLTNPSDDALGDEHPEWKRDNGWPVGVGPIVWGFGALLIVAVGVVLYFVL